MKQTLLFFAIILFSTTLVRAENITFNFQDADISTVIKFVAEFSGQNFLIDNRVRGKVSIISPKPVDEKMAYDVFLAILRVNGYAAIPSGPVTKIVPLAEAKQAGVAVQSGGTLQANDSIVTRVISLKHADAQQLVSVIRPLMSPTGNLVAYLPGNLLILTEASSNIRKLLQIITSLDVSEVVGMKMFPLQYASAEKMSETLTKLYGDGGLIPGGGRIKQNPQSGIQFKVFAYNPSNTLIVISSGAVYNEVEKVIQQLDVQPEPDSGRLQVRYLRHANAEDVAKVLTDLVSGSEQSANPAGGGVQQAIFRGNVRITSDSNTNALLITADQSDREALNKIVDKLDIRRLQVFIESLIVEVGSDSTRQLGIEWATGNDFGGDAFVGAQGFGNLGSLGALVGSDTLTAAAAVLPAGLAAGVVLGSPFNNGNVSIGAIVRALEGNADTNVLSTPNLLTMDNEEAEIVVGQNVPFVTGQNVTQGGTANPFQTIERRDIGLTLRVKPQISEGNTIRLDIYQEVSSIAPGTVSASDIITNKRSLKTTVLANNKQMIVLGGLIRDDVTESVQRVPCLGSIPLLGEFFRFTNNTSKKTNLMIFLRPHIINNNNDIRTITQEKYMKIKDLYEIQPKGGSIFIPRKPQTMPKDTGMVP